MPRRRQIEFPQAVSGQGVGTALEHDGARAELGDSRVHHRSEDRLVALVIDPVPQRGVEREALARADADVVQRARPGEEAVAILVEGDGEDSVRRQEGFFDAVAVVDIDVDVEYAVFFFFFRGGGGGR